MTSPALHCITDQHCHGKGCPVGATVFRARSRKKRVLLNIRIFAARDDFFHPNPYLSLWGRMASCGRLEIGPLSISRKLRQADFQSAADYQSLPTCPTFAAKPHCATFARDHT